MVDIVQVGLSVDSRSVDKGTKSLDRLAKQGKRTETATKKMSKSFKALGVIIGAAGLGLAFRSIIKLAVEQERAVTQLNAAIESTGGAAGFTSKELQGMASDLQKVTNYGDEAIISMQSILLTFTNLKGDVLPATTEAVLDLSTRMGIDLQSAAVQLGKALNDPIANLSALSRSGIQFSDSQKAVIKGLVETNRLAEAQKIILGELQTQFGGSAKAARDTFGGALVSLENAFGDLLEGDGNMTEAKIATEELIKVLQDEATIKAFSGMVAGIVSVTSSLIGVIPKLNEFGKSIGIALAGDGKKSLEEINEEIDNTRIAIQTAQNQLKVAEGGRGIISFLNTDPEKVRQEISGLIADLELLQMSKDRLEKPAETATGKADSGATDAADASAKAKADAKRIELEMIAGVEFEAETDRLFAQIELDDQKLTAKLEFNERMLAADMDYYDRLYNMESGSQQAALDFTSAVRENDLKSAVQNGALMLSNLAKQSKTMFGIQKAFALANAAVALPDAVMQSYRNGGGFPWGIIPAGLMLANGLKQIQSIKSATFGGGASAPSIGGGGSTSPSAPVASGLPQGSTALPDAAEQPTVKELRVTVEGDGAGSEYMRSLAENLAETIEDMGGVSRLVLS